uniref:Ephrin-A3b n=1 Tax=Cyprinus carpio TaxID=7962 RepID=A0A8C1YHU6_CYPCA
MALFALCLFILTLTCTNFDLVTAARHAVHWNSSNILPGSLFLMQCTAAGTCRGLICFHWDCSRPAKSFYGTSAVFLMTDILLTFCCFVLATPTHHHGRSCLRLRVFVCCSSASDSDDETQPTEPDYTLRPNIKIDDLDDYDNPEVPKLEKSISGSSPSRDRLLLTVASLFLITLSVS